MTERNLAQQLGVSTVHTSGTKRRSNIKSGHVRPGAKAKRERCERAYARGGTIPAKTGKYV